MKKLFLIGSFIFLAAILARDAWAGIAIPAGSEVTISWNAATDKPIPGDPDEGIPDKPEGSGILGYDVYRNSIKLNADPVTELSYTDTPPTGICRYRVVAIDGVGNKGPKSDPSEEVISDNEAPNVVTGVTVTVTVP